MALDLAAILATVIDERFKGLPQSAQGLALGRIGSLGLEVLREDLLLPAALLKASALAHNSAWMQGFLALTGTQIAPHGKTTMAPQLFDRQLRDGAWALTAATVSQLRVYRRHGVQRILFANQLIGPADIDFVLAELQADPAFEFWCLVDSQAALARLLAGLECRPIGRPLQVLLEVGVTGGRTGVRSFDEGLVLGRTIRAAGSSISLCGIETFEAVFAGYDHLRLEVQVQGMLDLVDRLARAGAREGWFGPGPLILTAGGSAFFDIVARSLSLSRVRSMPGRDTRVVLRSGCYLTHDSDHYEAFARRMRERMPELAQLGPGPRAALEIVAYVQSAPEPNRVIANFGKRDASFDLGLPRPVWWFRPGLHAAPMPLADGTSVSGLNDQHAYLAVPNGHPLQVGDMLGFGISHPCTTFDKWPVLLVVDDAYRVVSAVRTFF